METRGSNYYLRNRDREMERSRQWREDNKERHVANNREWRRNNKEAHKLQGQRYNQKYPEKIRERNARRRAKKLNATPKWLTERDKQLISSMYYMAQKTSELTGIPHEVDHIYPLQASNVCGLHVATNLQILPRSSNRLKRNVHQEPVWH